MKKAEGVQKAQLFWDRFEAIAEAAVVRQLVSKFAGRCSHCKQWFPQGTVVLWEPGRGAWHEQCPQVQVQVHEPRLEVHVNLQPIHDFISRAKAYLKWPKAHFLGLASEDLISGLQADGLRVQ